MATGIDRDRRADLLLALFMLGAFLAFVADLLGWFRGGPFGR